MVLDKETRWIFGEFAVSDGGDWENLEFGGFGIWGLKKLWRLNGLNANGS